MKLVFYKLPKVSGNLWYAGVHWSKRKKIKEVFTMIAMEELRCQTTHRKFVKPCNVEYIFEFKGKALDCSNCAGGMVKLLEDILFPDDSPKIVKSIKITSLGSVEDKVTVIIKELNK